MIARLFSMRRHHREVATEIDPCACYVGAGDQFDDDRRLVRAVTSRTRLRPARQNLSSRPELPVLFDRRAYLRPWSTFTPV